MKYKIDEAIIIETYEVEPVYPIELIEVEPVRENRRKRRSRGIFGSIIDNIFDLFFEEPDFEPEPVKEDVYEPPEIALIVQTDELPIQEIHYFYAEIVNE